jgi:hypothetical protein
MRYLAVDRPFLRVANEAVLPFFILHQTVLLIVGYFVMTWQIQDALKWVIVFISSFIIIILLYVLLVRKFELLRFLFGMKTVHPFFDIFRKKWVLILLHMLYVGLIVLAVSGSGRIRAPMPLAYEPEQDILLNAESITDQSSTGVQVIHDERASIGKAIEFTSGARQRAESQPTVFFEMRFSAPEGRYVVWLRGTTDIDSAYTDNDQHPVFIENTLGIDEAIEAIKLTSSKATVRTSERLQSFEASGSTWKESRFEGNRIAIPKRDWVPGWFGHRGRLGNAMSHQ